MSETEIYDLIRQTYTSQAELTTKVDTLAARLDERCPAALESIHRVEKILDGNNGIGLRGRVEVLENQIGSDNWLKKHSSKMLAAILAALSALVAYACGVQK